jgi:hypothetical protein
VAGVGNNNNTEIVDCYDIDEEFENYDLKP